jgi:GH15 family glucan-1,4-alpha-glucosidase
VPLPAAADHELARHSIRLLLSEQTPEGAYPASPTFSAYRGYCWFRDGSFIADAVSASGHAESADRFFDWCARVLTDRADHIRWIVAESEAGRPPAGDRMLPARFTFAGGDGTDDWWDFQLDGYGTWLWALAAHRTRHAGSAGDLARWQDAVDLTVDYLIASWSRPCYDWWEEHAPHIHVSTLACIGAGLDAVAGYVSPERATRIADAADGIRAAIDADGLSNGHLAKWLGSTAVDGSLASAIAPLGFIEATSEVARQTLAVLDAHLSVGGGVHRYLGDTFFGGGQWPLLSCFLGLAHLAAGDRAAAEGLYEWAVSTATPGGDLPEQVGEHLIAPGMTQYWIDRWGPVATPLLWSHAMVLRLGLDLGRLTPELLASPLSADHASLKADTKDRVR